MDENERKDLRKTFKSILNASQNLIVPSHIHNGSDSPQLNPANFLGFPVQQVANSTTAPTDIGHNGEIRFFVDVVPTYKLWVYLSYYNTATATIIGAWKSVALT